ncbi:mini-chromosome maintenance complex-binding protein-like [Branchiostoma floridae]|uniref:Mini-chromosome maintenance complex-binding protein n=1 Tax=Branchiostoma floridae TaxID=7739 RepID=A0A9J7MN45_BRAFL|nr:mini-chromosome maintenance complex-binding protein-like [Branchiostoma floridae]
MPSVEDWLHNPLGIIQGIFDQHGDSDLPLKVGEYFQNRLGGKDALAWVPSLNDTPLHHLKPNSLVKFRCMVQDMFDPEFYLGVYEVTDTKFYFSLRSGRYKDIAECLPHQEINLESSQNVTLDRQTLYCVPVPGENPWVKQGFTNSSQARVLPSTSYQPVRNKRGLEEEEDQTPLPGNNAPTSEGQNCSREVSNTPEPESTEAKRTRTEDEAGALPSPIPDLNFPLPGETGPACLVKVYQSSDSLKLNDVIEFVGVLSIDPALATFNTAAGETATSAYEDGGDMMDIEEQAAHSPPPSLVPRLHAILTNKLVHTNPGLPVDLTTPTAVSGITTLTSEVPQIRQQLCSLLTEALLGDSLAAEYLLLHLISSVYGRRDVVALGKFSLNISGCPGETSYPQLLYRLLQELTTKSHFLPLTLANMNSLRIIPKKDYTANRLLSGVLQLSERTLLVLDETQLEPGQLQTTGVLNVQALGTAVQWQKVDYDFDFHKTEFPCNLRMLLLSEGRSLIQTDCQVPLQPPSPPQQLENTFQRVQASLTGDYLAKVRSYLTVTELMEYTLPEDIQKVIEEDFVQMRSADPKNMTAEDLHSLLVVARLLALSIGQTTLSQEVWGRAKQLETERKTRVKAQPQTQART